MVFYLPLLTLRKSSVFPQEINSVLLHLSYVDNLFCYLFITSTMIVTFSTLALKYYWLYFSLYMPISLTEI